MVPFLPRYYFSILVFMLLFLRVSATDPDPITYLGIEQGLSNNSVRAIYQDRKGFMWFGTYDGLNRYDGYDFKIFRNRLNDTSSLPHNYIYTIHEDHDNNLWVGTGQGIGIFNNITSRFKPAYYLPYKANLREKISMNVNDIKTDRDGNIYIGTNGEGLMIQGRMMSVAIQVPIRSGSADITEYNVREVLVDRRQRIWLFIQEFGLCKYDPMEGKIFLVTDAVKVSGAIVEGGDESIWIGSNNGLHRFSMTSNSITQTYPQASGSLNSSYVASMALDGQKLWIGTEGGGVNIFDLDTDHFEYLLPGPQKNRISSESVFAIYIDSASRKWLGTLKGGINLMDPSKGQFRVMQHDPLNSNSLVNNFAAAFLEDQSNNLWIGTDGGGLSNWNRSTGNFENYRNQSGNPNSLSNNQVSSIIKDHKGNIWIATFGGGVNRFDRVGGRFEHFPCVNDETGFENKNALIFYEDRNQILWLTTFARGRLYYLDRDANRFRVFDQQLNDLISIAEDSDGQLWAGNAVHLVQIDKVSHHHLFFEMGKPVRAIYESRNGELWVGTEGGGLVLFDRKQGKIKARYSDQDGLCNNSVLNILEDEKGNLWMSTFNGLSRFDPRAKTFKNYYQGDGLPGNQFLFHSAIKLKSGELVFGGIRGFILFYPDRLKQAARFSSMYITGFRVNNVPLSSGINYIKKTRGGEIEALEIPYDEAILSFDFSALEYSSPDRIVYSYFLEGWDKGWNDAGKLRTANYTRLKEGNYLLRIKAADADGTWTSPEKTVRISILPPWYRTWWAYLAYLFIAIGVVYAYLQYRTRRTRLEYEVKIAHIETEKEKELSEKKQSFFTNVSHEFRTPLTLIINPLKDMLSSQGDNGKSRELNIVYRNARRLLNLVNQLLLFQKAGADADSLKITGIPFFTFCKDIYDSFLNQAKSKNIDYRFECENEKLELWGDREKLEIILYNLLSNAFKYTPDGGRIRFAVLEKDNEIEVAVEDTGKGIPDEIGDKLFERFYKVDDSTTAPMPGFGIGLFLVKHFTEKHQGHISYTSKLGEGTTFYLTLLKGKEHFGELPVLEHAEVMTETPQAMAEEGTGFAPKNESLVLSDEIITGQKSILVVEDNVQIRQYILGIFKDRFTTYEAASGDEGFKLAEKHQPDIVISDIMMQNGTGIELCRRIKESASLGHTPVILLTAVSADEVRLKGVEGGADDYITKPFEKDLLVARVNNLLQNRTQLQKYFYNEITLQKQDGKISAEYKEFLEKCIAVIEKHLEEDNFNIKVLARELGMSHSNLYRKVKSISGQSVNSFIRFIRLRKAAEMMIRTGCNVNEAAFQVGISDIKYFRKQFHELFGLNPSDYIKKYREPFNKEYSIHEKLNRRNS